MTAKVAIVDAADDHTVLGHVDEAMVRYDGGRGTVVGQAAQHLKTALGHGYGRRVFHLVLSAVRLSYCRVVSPHVVFVYASAQPLDEDDAPTEPDRPVVWDEDTDCGAYDG
jgi:hypothetical protein